MVDALTMLLSILPVTVVLTTIRPGKHSMTLLFIIHVLTFILSSIGPCKYTCTIHLVVLPLSVVLSAIGPSVNTVTMDVVLLEFAGVSGTISPEELTSSVLLTVAVLALIAGIVRPDFLAITMLLILKPVSFVASAICVMIISKSVCFVIFPLAIIDVTICVNKATTTHRLVSSPVTFIERAINPDLNTLAILAAKFIPLTLVLCTVVKGHQGALHADNTIGSWARLKVEWFERIADLHNQLASFQDLLICLCVSWCLEGSMLRLESVFCFHGSTRHQTLEVALHRNGGLVFILLWIVVRALASNALSFLRIKLGLIRLGSATSLTHTLN